jgi:glycosyltransferase involved in cell wall biosynthesis
MRILLINKYARVTGGSDLHCLELASGLRERGHEVRFLSTAGPDNLDREGAFVPRIVSNVTRGDLPPVGAAKVALRSLWNRSAAAAMRHLIDEFGPDVAHFHKLYPQLSVAPVSIASSRGVPVVQTLHDYEFISASPLDDSGGSIDRDESTATYRVLNTALFGVKRFAHVPRVDRWITVSRSTAEAYAERGIEPAVLPNFTRPFEGRPLAYEARAGVVFIGRLSPEKGLRHVLALPDLIPDLPIRVAGEGPLVGEVERAATAAPRLAYLGRLDRGSVTELLGSARVVVMPSLWREPGPLSALEAMAAGTPIVAYENGGLAEYVSDARGGIVIPPSVENLAEAVAAAYGDRARWEELSASARHAVEERHTLPVYLDRLERVYAEGVARRVSVSP